MIRLVAELQEQDIVFDHGIKDNILAFDEGRKLEYRKTERLELIQGIDFRPLKKKEIDGKRRKP